MDLVSLELRVMTTVVSYLLGSFLTAEIVVRKLTGKPCKYLGTTGNPGMANVMAHLGFGPGIVVLLGDVCKVIIAMLITRFYIPMFVAGTMTGSGNAVLNSTELWTPTLLYYSALGCCLGHNYPFWQPTAGGKGVAVTNFSMIVIHPFWGLLSNIIGMILVFATQYLGLGAVVIPLLYVVPVWYIDGREAGIVTSLLACIMVLRNRKSLKEIWNGEGEKVDVLGAIKRKFGR